MLIDPRAATAMYRKAPCRDSEWSHAASLQSLSCVYYVHSRRWNLSPLRVEAELNPLAKRDFGRFESVFCPFPNETVSQVARESAAEVQLVLENSAHSWKIGPFIPCIGGSALVGNAEPHWGTYELTVLRKVRCRNGSRTH